MTAASYNVFRSKKRASIPAPLPSETERKGQRGCM
jgi:hypothetical protein